MYLNFGALHAPLPKKILHLVSYKMLDFTSFLKSKLISIYDFWGCIENWQGKLFSMFFPTDAGDFTCSAGFFHSCGRFYMLAGRVGEIVSRRDTPSQCGRVESPD